jgi:hypothetical protein
LKIIYSKNFNERWILLLLLFNIDYKVIQEWFEGNLLQVIFFLKDIFHSNALSEYFYEWIKCKIKISKCNVIFSHHFK